MEDGPAAPPRVVRQRRRWWNLRKRWRMLGVFEITPEHEFYHLTSIIKEGTQVSIQKGLTTAAPDQLTDEHFKIQDAQTHEGFELQTFAAPVFAYLRRSLDISEEEYMNSLCSDECYLQFVSNSKSKADFFVTHDKRFFLKTQSEREIQFLLSKLKAYMEHLKKYPHSLMVRFLGVYRIVIPNKIKKYFIVMQSVFYPDERINIRYDVKGCEVGRWTNPDTGGKQIIKVLKDNNFKGQSINLGPEKSWFTEQVRADVAFLRGLNVLDYSLLIAQQPLHRDEQDRKHTFSNLVLRTTKSLDLDSPTAPLLAHASRTSRADPPPDSSGTSQADPPPDSSGTSRSDPPPDSIPLVPRCSTRAQSQLQEFGQHHRRLLPNCKNAVHVVDGPDKRYFVGIIDIFTVYGWKKRLEHAWKRLRFPGRAFSTVSPQKYSPRFCQWIQDRTE